MKLVLQSAILCGQLAQLSSHEGWANGSMLRQVTAATEQTGLLFNYLQLLVFIHLLVQRLQGECHKQFTLQH